MKTTRKPTEAGFEIPADVAVCPECGGRLTLVEDFDIEGEDPPSMDCENETDLADDEDDPHRFWQSDWQPVIDLVAETLRKQAVEH